MNETNYVTKKRPPTEPYDIWCARRRMQQKSLRQYLKGRPFWISMIVAPTFKEGLIIPTGTKRVKVQGPYRVPLCPLCGKKDKQKKGDKYCHCVELLES